MGGHIFDIGVPNQADLFSTTIKKLVNNIGRTVRESQDIRQAIEMLKMIINKLPVKRKSNKSTEDERKAEEEVMSLFLSKNIDAYSKRENMYHQNKAIVYSLVIG